MPAVVTAPARQTLKTISGEVVEVHRILCVGKNYADHVAEMGGDPKADPPLFFDKPPSCVVQSGATIPYPPNTSDLHFEAELVLVIGTGGAEIEEASALDHVYGYAVGNDLTRRDLQGLAKGSGTPWCMAKGFDNSAVIGAVTPVAQVGHPTTGAITCHVDGAMKQDGDLSQMIWSVPEIIATLSRTVTLQPGDVIMTGTPAGVGPLQRGETCVCAVEGLGEAVVTIAA
ncbi:fumarylacetoacetate hydrolase family protein [Pseudooctadecabacter jejudonensis]|uniref:Fumarylpyruvate hydrolase n=1 Tax=Pseudooctadecabacter jejudonensis TaxID=1391910 RepID=A0A1Y5T6I2_9RHOB|nr:fumarylacetoacetate hydrolase family protein [Pseudooctadecabacter jejudonensis]SLN54851.1 Fumarylpyruvate hydrolase [Pseudooctadecabacter jejudonensis]